MICIFFQSLVLDLNKIPTLERIINALQRIQLENDLYSDESKLSELSDFKDDMLDENDSNEDKSTEEKMVEIDENKVKSAMQ